MRVFGFAALTMVVATSLLFPSSNLLAKSTKPPANYFDEAANDWRGDDDPVSELVVEVESSGQVRFFRRALYLGGKRYDWPALEYRAAWSNGTYEVYAVDGQGKPCGSPLGELATDGSVEWTVASDEVVYYRPADNRFYQLTYGALVDPKTEPGWLPSPNGAYTQYTRERNSTGPNGARTVIKDRFFLMLDTSTETVYTKLARIVVASRNGKVLKGAQLQVQGSSGAVFLVLGTKSAPFGRIEGQRRLDLASDVSIYEDYQGITTTIARVATINEDGVLGFRLTTDPNWREEICDDTTTIGGGLQIGDLVRCQDCK